MSPDATASRRPAFTNDFADWFAGTPSVFRNQLGTTGNVAEAMPSPVAGQLRRSALSRCAQRRSCTVPNTIASFQDVYLTPSHEPGWNRRSQGHIGGPATYRPSAAGAGEGGACGPPASVASLSMAKSVEELRDARGVTSSAPSKSRRSSSSCSRFKDSGARRRGCFSPPLRRAGGSGLTVDQPRCWRVVFAVNAAPGRAEPAVAVPSGAVAVQRSRQSWKASSQPAEQRGRGQQLFLQRR